MFTKFYSLEIDILFIPLAEEHEARRVFLEEEAAEKRAQSK